VILENVFIEGIKRYKNTFSGCNKIESRGVDESILVFEQLDQKYFPFFDDTDRFEDRYDQKFGLMYRPIFQRESEDGRFEILLYEGLRWLYLDLDPVAFAAYAGENTYYRGD